LPILISPSPADTFQPLIPATSNLVTGAAVPIPTFCALQKSINSKQGDSNSSVFIFIFYKANVVFIYAASYPLKAGY
jgi:SH3-like domain-containing protein